jgi:hypothetical protein
MLASAARAARTCWAHFSRSAVPLIDINVGESHHLAASVACRASAISGGVCAARSCSVAHASGHANAATKRHGDGEATDESACAAPQVSATTTVAASARECAEPHANIGGDDDVDDDECVGDGGGGSGRRNSMCAWCDVSAHPSTFHAPNNGADSA